MNPPDAFCTFSFFEWGGCGQAQMGRSKKKSKGGGGGSTLLCPLIFFPDEVAKNRYVTPPFIGDGVPDVFVPDRLGCGVWPQYIPEGPVARTFPKSDEWFIPARNQPLAFSKPLDSV